MSFLAPRLRRAGAGAAVLLLLFTGVACGDSDAGGTPAGNDNGGVNAPGNPTDTKPSTNNGDNYGPGDTAVPGQPNTGEESGGTSGSDAGTGGGSGSAGGSGGSGSP